MKEINYLVLSITFPYQERLDDEFDNAVQEKVSDLYLGFEYLGSETDGKEKTSQYSMKIWEIDSSLVDDIMYEISLKPMFSHTNVEWSIMDEGTAVQEGYSF